jgi:hypothetical protein
MKVTDLARGQTYESTTHGPVKYMGLRHTGGEISAEFKILNRTNTYRHWSLEKLDQHFPSGAAPIANPEVVVPDDCDDSTALRRIYARDAKRAARRISPARKALAWTTNTLAGGCLLAGFALCFVALWLRSV